MQELILALYPNRPELIITVGHQPFAVHIAGTAGQFSFPVDKMAKRKRCESLGENSCARALRLEDIRDREGLLGRSGSVLVGGGTDGASVNIGVHKGSCSQHFPGSTGPTIWTYTLCKPLLPIIQAKFSSVCIISGWFCLNIAVSWPVFFSWFLVRPTRIWPPQIYCVLSAFECILVCVFVEVCVTLTACWFLWLTMSNQFSTWPDISTESI